MDIRPPRTASRQSRPRDLGRVATSSSSPLPPRSPQSVLSQSSGHEAVHSTQSAIAAGRSRKRIVVWVLSAAVAFLCMICLGLFGWYNWALKAVSASGVETRFVVQSGAGAATIATDLREHGLIRSELAFRVYTSMSGSRHKLQAGGYILSPAQDVPTIVEHMVSGKTDEFDITIPPGLTLEELRAQFRENGFSDEEITRAFTATYEHPLLSDKPPTASLEGYIYPETYRMGADQSLETLLERSFDELYGLLQKRGYVAEFSKRGLSIYQALTLASIVQKEVMNPADQRQVAQVFYKRLSDGIQLGSDVTYMYAADKMGVEGTPSLDSPYNTRKYKGLPPGPIANMNPSAIEATAFPADGDFLYFVAGDGADEGKTFFARTEDEHNANIAAHCHVLCR